MPNYKPDSVKKDFFKYLTSRELSLKSFKNYKSDISHFIAWAILKIRSFGSYVESLTEIVPFLSDKFAVEYRHFMVQNGVPVKTVNRRLSTLRNLSRFLFQSHTLDSDFTKDLKNIGTSPKNRRKGSPVTNDFKSYLEEQKVSPNTIKNYLSDVRHFTAFHPTASEITSKSIEGYKQSLASDFSQATIKRKLISLKKFVDWARSQGITEANFRDKARIPAKSAGNFKSKDKDSKLHKWYKRYQSVPGAAYLSIAIVLLLGSILGLGIYNQFYKNTTSPLALTALNRPNRYLSFQGRLTDEFGNPVTTATDVVFKLWDHTSNDTEVACDGGGDENCLWTSSTCSISPDQDGIFSTLLGSSCGTELSSSVFADNADVWLGVTVDTDDEATPRVQIATVAYALNSETLQGYPASASATINTVPVLNNSGQMVLAASSPKIQSTSGTFAIEGQALTVSTPTASDGDITISPGGAGVLNLTFSGSAPGGSAEGFVNATNASLTSDALYYGEVGSDATGYNLIELASGDTPRTKFAVDSAGNATLSGTINGLAISSGTITSGAWNGTAIGTQYGGTGQNWSSVAQGSVPYFNGTGTMDALGPTTSGYVLTTQGAAANPVWADVTSLAGVNYWSVLSDNTIYPTNTLEDLLLGSSATVSAKFAFTGVGSGTPTASISGTAPVATYLTGNGNLAVTNMAHLTIGGGTTGGVDFSSPITSGTWNGTAIGATYGGTGQTSYAVGDLLYADTTTSLNKLADVATGNVLLSGGIGVAPSWGKVTLGTHTTGNYVSSIAGTANQISASGSTGDVTLSIPSDFRAPGTVNAVNGIYTGATAGTQRIDASGNLINIVDISASGYATVSGSLALGNTVASAGPGHLDLSGNITAGGTINGLTVSSGTISSGTWQATAIGTQYGGTGQDFSAVAQGSILYFDGAGTMAALGPTTADYVLTTQGAAANPQWKDVSTLVSAGDNYWALGTGTIYPGNTTLDLLLGNSATASAKFAFKNVLAGVPTASISGTTAGVATYLTGEGNLAVTNGAHLTLGGGTTGQVDVSNDLNLASTKAYLIDGTSVLNATTLGTNVVTSSLTTVGILNSGSINTGFGTINNGSSDIITTGTIGSVGASSFTGNDLTLDNQFTSSYANSAAINLTGNAAGITFTGTGVDQIITAASQDLALMPGGSVGIGTTVPTAKLDVAGTASVSGTLAFRAGGGTIQSTNFNPLTLGGSTTGNITLNPSNAIDGGSVAPNTTDVTNLGTPSLLWKGVYATALYQGTYQVCDSSGANCPAGATTYWGQDLGATFTLNNTSDVLIGSTATTSAKFAFINVLTGTPTASISGTAPVATYLTGDGNLAVTNGAHLTLGGGTTGQVDVSNDLNLASTKAYLIDGTSVLNATTLGTNVVTSSLTTVGALASGSIASGFGTITTANTITGTTINGTTGINTGASAGTQRIDNLGNLVNIADISASGYATISASLALGNTTAAFGPGHLNMSGDLTIAGAISPGGDPGSSGYLLTSSAGGVNTWTDPSTLGGGTTYWQLTTNSLSPVNSTYALNIGNTASTSAYFHVPGTNDQDAWFNLGTGNLGIGTTEPNAPLQIGSGSNTHTMGAGDVLVTSDLELDGVLYLDGGQIANSAGTVALSLSGTPTTTYNALSAGNWLVENTANVGQSAFIINQLKGGDIFTASASGVPKMTLTNAGNLGIGTTSPGAKLAIAMPETPAGFSFLINNTGSSELITATNDRTFAGAGNWTGTNWAISGGTFLHTAGSTADAVLANANMTAGSIINGRTYIVTYTTTGSAGTLTPKLGTAAAGVASWSFGGTISNRITADADNANLIFTPSSDFNGSIDDVSVVRVEDSLAFTDTGRLGIGTTSPTATLETYGSAPIFTRYLENQAASPQTAVQIGLAGPNSAVASVGPSFLFHADNSSGTKSWLGRLSAIWENPTAGSETAGISFSVRSGTSDTYADTEAMRITSTGSVGIGTTAPTARLEVKPSFSSVAYSSAGTYYWDVPSGVTSVTVEAWGGGGGADVVSLSGGGGGGGGAYARTDSVSVTPGATITVVVGAVGTGSTAPTDGGNSTFNSTTVVAAGGSKGVNAAGGAGGTTAASTGADAEYAGGNGGSGNSTGDTGGGGGGAAGPDGAGVNGTSGTSSYGGAGGHGDRGFGGSGGLADVNGGTSPGGGNGEANAKGGGGGGGGDDADPGGNGGATGGGGGGGEANGGGNGATGQVIISNASPILSVQDDGGNGVLTVIGNENVGIGTTAPTSTLDVIGNIQLTGVVKGNDVGARVYNNSNISVAGGVSYPTFNSESFDTHNMHDTTVYPDGVGIKIPGKYVINFGYYIASLTNILDICLEKNATDFVACHKEYYSSGRGTVTGVVDLVSNDFIVVYMNNAGSSTTLYYDELDSPVLSVVRIAGADIAEYYPTADQSINYGDLITTAGNGKITKTTSFGQKAIGIVSTNPALVLGNSPDIVNNRLVGLAGRVPLKVAVSGNSIINAGDALTSSNIPGIAQRADGVGYTAATALERFDPSTLNCVDVESAESVNWEQDMGIIYGGKCYHTPDDTYIAKVLVMVNNSWQDPQAFLADTSNFDIVATTSGAIAGGVSNVPNIKYTLANNVGEMVTRVGAFSDLIAANIKAGAIEAKDVTTDGFTAFQGTVDTLLIKSGLVAANIQTNLISPIPDTTDVTVQVGTASESGRLIVQNGNGEQVAAIDSSGSAAFAGQVLSDSLEVANEATVSGTLFADNIKSQSLDDIKNLLTQVTADQNLLKEAANWNTLTSTNSANLNDIVVSDLYVTNQAAVNSLSIADFATVGSDLVFQSQTTDQGTLLTSINTLSAPLKIQSLAMAPVEIMAGLVTIDTQGNVNIAGNLYVAGKIQSSSLDLLANSDASPSAKLLTLQNQTGQEVSSVNASGSAEFRGLSTQGLTIAGADATVAGVLVDGFVTTNSSIGQAIIPAGTSEITIKNPNVTNYTLVYVTPTSSTENNVLFVKSKKDGEFTVGFTNPLNIDVNFNWWIVQVQN